MTTVDQDLDHFDHFGNVSSGPRFVRRRQAAECGVGIVQFAFETVGVSGLTISVTNRPSRAAFSIQNPAAVEQFLRAILATE